MEDRKNLKKPLKNGSVYFLIAKFHSVSEVYVGFLGAVFGFSVFLAPIMFPVIRDKLRLVPSLYYVFDEVTKLNTVVVVVVLTPALLVSVIQAVGLSKGFPGGWDIREKGMLPTAKEVIEYELFPTSRGEEFIFLLWVVLKFFGVVVWTFPFVFLAYFMRIWEFK